MSVIQLRRQLFDNFPASSGVEEEYVPRQFDIGGDVIDPSIGMVGTADEMFRSTGPRYDEGVYTRPDPETERLNPRWATPAAAQAPTPATVSEPASVLKNPLDSRTDESIDLEAELNKISAPERAALDRYNALLDQFPTNERPNIMRRIAASVGGFTQGADEARKVMEEPNVRNLAEWKERVGPEYNAVQAETSRNNTNRQLATQFLASTVADRRNTLNAKNQEERNKILQQKNEIEWLHRQGQGWKFLPMADGYLYGFKGEEVFNTGIKASEWSPAQLMMLKIAGQIAVKETVPGSATGGTGTGGTGTGTTPGAGGVDTGKGYQGADTPDERNQAAQNAYYFLYNNDRMARKYIVQGEDGKFNMGPLPTETAEINEYMAVWRVIAKTLGNPPGTGAGGLVEVPELPRDWNGPKPGLGTEPEGRNPDGTVRPGSALAIENAKYAKEQAAAKAAAGKPPAAPGKGWFERGVTEGVTPYDPNKGWWGNAVSSSIFGERPGATEAPSKPGLPPGMEAAINVGGAAYGTAANWYRDLMKTTAANEPAPPTGIPPNAQPTMPVRPPVNPSIAPESAGAENIFDRPGGGYVPPPPVAAAPPPPPTARPDNRPIMGPPLPPEFGGPARNAPNAPFPQNEALDVNLQNIQLFNPDGTPAYHNGREAWIEPTLENIQKAKAAGYSIFVGGKKPQPAGPVPPGPKPTAKRIPQGPTSGPVAPTSNVNTDVIKEGMAQGVIILMRSPDGRTMRAIATDQEADYARGGWTRIGGGE